MMKIRDVTQSILCEIGEILQELDNEDINRLVKEILTAHRIVVFGVGRMGLVSRAFVMRLCHLGLEAFAFGESTTPRIGPKDLVIVNSGSGETQTIFDITSLAKEAGAKIVAITARPNSRIGLLADIVVNMPGPTKHSNGKDLSKQPMTTLYDQSLLILLDGVVIMLMSKTKQTSADLWARHCNLE
jgi:6-phospho-3-hexuloisomerase